jgi:hypothetical protein
MNSHIISNAVSGALAADTANRQNNTAATNLCLGESKSSVIDSEFIRIIILFKISSAVVKRQKKDATSLYWGRGKDNN